jgi:hypothetical protein
MRKKGAVSKGPSTGGEASATANNGSESPNHDISSSVDRATLMQIRAQREALEAKLDELDDRIFSMETIYLRDAAVIGSLFDGFGQSAVAAVRPPQGASSATVRRRGTFAEADRIFSASSGSSAAKLRKRMRDLEPS